MTDSLIVISMQNPWQSLLYNHVPKDLDTHLMVDFILPEL